jgi:uncharacterized protein (TIGR00725 family)
MNKTIIGVMGGGQASEQDMEVAYRLGGLIAKEGWVLLNGGRQAGIMEASAKGAKDQGGLTVGILPDKNPGSASRYIDIQILTGMGDARNCINVLSSDVVIACPGKAGTLSEIALALRSRRKVILLNFDVGKAFDTYLKESLLFKVKSPEEAIAKVKQVLRSEVNTTLRNS